MGCKDHPQLKKPFKDTYFSGNGKGQHLLEKEFQWEEKTTHTVKNLFASLMGGGTTLVIFKANHTVRRKSVSLRPCVQNSLASKTYSTRK